MRVHIRIFAIEPLPFGKISRAASIGMSWQKHAAEFLNVAKFRGSTVNQPLTCMIPFEVDSPPHAMEATSTLGASLEITSAAFVDGVGLDDTVAMLDDEDNG